jgi:general stress protein 26
MEGLQHIVEKLREFDTAMLVTRTDDGALHARPMQIACVEDSGRITFATGQSSHKVQELLLDDHVVVVLQKKDLYLRVTGRAELHVDPARIDALWSEVWRAWFPQGKDDPELVLLEIDPVECELWDDQGWRGVQSFAAMAKAIATGKRADAPHGHEIVRP